VANLVWVYLLYLFSPKCGIGLGDSLVSRRRGTNLVWGGAGPTQWVWLECCIILNHHVEMTTTHTQSGRWTATSISSLAKSFIDSEKNSNAIIDILECLQVG
jgi:hypothetical protein